MTQPDSHALRLPEGFAWSCHSSGHCCRDFPSLPVDAATADAMQQVDWAPVSAATGGAITSADDVLLRIPGAAGRACELRHKDDGACVLLDAANRCTLHAAHGAAAKPATCRTFPFHFRETPGGTFVGLSFVCPSVRSSRGLPVADQVADLTHLRALGSSASTCTGTILLTRRCSVSWNLYLRIEALLASLLAESSLPLRQRLTALNLLINFIHRFAEESGTLTPGTTDVVEIPESALGPFLDTIERNGCRDLHRVSARPRPSPLIRRLFLGLILGFAGQPFLRRSRFGMAAYILRSYARHALPFGAIRLPGVAHAAPLARVLDAPLPSPGEPGDALLTRYFTHALFRKDLLLHGTLLRGVNLLLLNAALAAVYAESFAADAARLSPAEEDYDSAIGQIERLVGHHSALYTTLASHESLNEVLETFFLRRNYAFVICGADATRSRSN